MGREDDPVDTGPFRAAEERADVVRVRERVEHKDERRFAAFLRAGEDVREAGKLTRLDDERDSLVAIEPGQRSERAALDLDDRDAQVRRVEDDLLEGGTAIRHDKQTPSGTARHERLFDRATTSDELLVGLQRIGWRERRRSRRRTVAGRPAVRIAITPIRRASLWVATSFRIRVPIR